MYCEDCGFPIDELNDSQPVCPRCGGLPADTDLNSADINCMVEDALATSGAREQAAQVVELELDQFDGHPLQIDDAEWAEEMIRLAKCSPAYIDFELLGLAAGAKKPGRIIN